jgi:hypothetical protein
MFVRFREDGPSPARRTPSSGQGFTAMMTWTRAKRRIGYMVVIVSCATNNARLEQDDCYAVPAKPAQPHEHPFAPCPPNSLDNHTDKAQRDGITGHNTPNNTGVGGRETRSRSRLQLEERDMWTALFILTLTAAISFGVAAIVLPHIKYLAPFGG